jgi:hypothetical protein
MRENNGGDGIKGMMTVILVIYLLAEIILWCVAALLGPMAVIKMCVEYLFV